MNKQETPKLRRRTLLIQISSAILFMWLVLHILDDVATSRVLWAAGASSLASTAYIVFCTPRSPAASLYRLFPAYLIALLVGLGMRYLVSDVCSLMPHCHPAQPEMVLFEVAAALSVGLSLFLMISLSVHHPPAAGLSIVMVLDVHNFPVIITVLVAGFLLGMIRTLFYQRLYDLI